MNAGGCDKSPENLRIGRQIKLHRSTAPMRVHQVPMHGHRRADEPRSLGKAVKAPGLKSAPTLNRPPIPFKLPAGDNGSSE